MNLCARFRVPNLDNKVRERPMSERTLDDIAEKLREIDFAILLTHTESGDIAGRAALFQNRFKNSFTIHFERSLSESWSTAIKFPCDRPAVARELRPFFIEAVPGGNQDGPIRRCDCRRGCRGA